MPEVLVPTNTPTRPAPSLAHLCHRVLETILSEAELRQAVVAAIKLAEILSNTDLVEPCDPPDVRLERDGLKIAGRQSRALLSQGRKQRV